MCSVVFIYINPRENPAGLLFAAGRHSSGPAEKGCTGQIGGRRAFGKRLLSPTRILRGKPCPPAACAARIPPKCAVRGAGSLAPFYDPFCLRRRFCLPV